MKNKTLLLIDGQNAAWRAYHAYSRLSFRDQGVGMVYGMPSMVGGLFREFNPCDIVIVWEGKKSPKRLRALPQYKQGRNSKSLIDYDDFLRQKKIAMKAMYLLGIPQAYNEHLEGDDLLYKLWRISKIRGYDKTIIISSDKDFNQMVGYDRSTDHLTAIFNEHKKKLITPHNIKQIFGYEARQTVDYLTLVGDKSDNIPGYRGIGEKKAIELLEKYGNLANFLNSKDKHPIINKKDLLELIRIAQIVINLEYHYDYFVKNVDRFKINWYADEMKPKINLKSFKNLAAKYNMQRLMGSNFLANFK